ncbi:MAG: hypothetical protein MJ101_05700 [Clostridia bacterium]|nr:hypothetical protein [Clostridia bacterium]
MGNGKIKLLAILDAVLLLSCIAVALPVLMLGISDNSASIYGILQSIADIVVAAFGAYYLFVGYTKESGKKYYKFYLYSFAVSVAVAFFGGYESPVVALLLAMTLSALCVMAFADDLGEVKSKVFAAIAGACVIAVAVMGIIGDKFDTVGIFTDFVISTSCYILVCAKYDDKKTRGTK